MVTWIEPCLTMPEEKLCFILRNSLDAYALAARFCGFVLAAHAALGLLLSRCRPVATAWVGDGNLQWLYAVLQTEAV